MEKERNFYEKAVRLEGQNSFVGMMEDAVQELILQRMNKDKLREKITYSWLSPERVAAYYAHMACNVAVQWIEGGMQVPIAELVEVYVIMAQKSMIESVDIYISVKMYSALLQWSVFAYVMEQTSLLY